MTSPLCGFREIEHTADWELKVWAPDLAGLLKQAAKGMYALMGACIRPESRQTRDVELKASDPESLLVAFLSELLYFSEQESLVFDGIGIELNGLSLRAHLDGAPLASIDKEIKAVTYHKLAVRKTELGYEVNVVFDV
jgi:SHS2 domain-containing protein